MKNRFFGKMLDIIGLEETDVDDDEYMEDDDVYDEAPPVRGRMQQYDDYQEDDYEDEPRVERKRARAERKNHGKVVAMPQPRASMSQMKMLVYRPMSYDDTQNIIDNLRQGKPVIVNLEELELDVAQRVLDFMSGAVYALSGSIFKVANGIFVLAPNSVDISGNVPDEMQGSSFYALGSGRRRTEQRA